MLAAEQTPTALFLLRWLLICSAVGILAGSASALFIVALAWVTAYREAHPGIIALLPLAGLGSGLVYHDLGRDVEQGNNLLLDEIHSPRGVISPRLVGPAQPTSFCSQRRASGTWARRTPAFTSQGLLPMNRMTR